MMVFFNLAFKDSSLVLAQDEFNYYDSSPEVANKIISDVSKYTIFDEDLEQTELAFNISQNDEYLTNNESLNTEKSTLEREYMVQKGDTITTIANKFEMHVASILDRNGLNVDDIENIKAGQVLIIPSKDTSDSKQWLADLNYKKEQERLRQIALEKKKQEEAAKKKKLAASKRSVASRSSSTSRSAVGYGGSFSGGFSIPISSKGISRGVSGGHAGIDYRADIGTPVSAAASGRVVEISDGWGSGYGKSIVVDHGGGYTTRYAHLSGFSVSTGESVSQGQIIGYSGNTGWSTGSHLHFETRANSTPINPY